MNEAELRKLAGCDKPVTFCGQEWEIRPEGLFSLLRYATASADAGLDNETATLAATHRFLEDCIVNFGAFEHAAMMGKADVDDVTGAAHAIVEHYCVRNYWPAMRLIGYAAASLDEIDGQMLLATGRGLVSMTAREVCNVALAMCLKNVSDEDREFFMEDLNWEGSPEAEALAKVRQMVRDREEREAGVRDG